MKQNLTAPADQPGRRVCWLPFDDAELAELVAAGWRETSREVFGSKLRIELSNVPLPPPPGPALGRGSRGPKIKFRKSNLGRPPAWL